MENFQAARLNIDKMFIGDDWTYIIEVVDLDDNPFDWDGWTDARSYIKDYRSKLLAVLTVTLTNGYITLKLNRTETELLPAGAFFYDIEAQDSTGELKTLIFGNFAILKTTTDTI